MSSDQPLHRKFNGHLGRLTKEQEGCLDKFKVSLEKAGLYTPSQGPNKASHDDATVLRFLRARRWDIAKAQKQFSEWMAWRRKYDVDNLFANFPTDEFEAARRYYPMWTGRRDKQGLPIYVYRLGAIDDELQKEINSVPGKRRYERIIVLYEAMTRFVGSLCTKLPHEVEPVPITAVTAIIDLGGTSIRQLWALRSHLQEASTLAQANYPETMGTVIVVNASSFFPTIWGWVKGWFDEVTRDKIHILGKNPGSSKMLSSIIEKKNLPKIYGGDLDWDFFDPPDLDEDAKKALGEMPKGPFIFEDGKVKRPKQYDGPLESGVEAEDNVADPAVPSAQPSAPQLNGDAHPEAVSKERELNEAQPAIEPDVAEAAKNLTLETRPEEVQAVSAQIEQSPEPPAEFTQETQEEGEDRRPAEVKIVDSKLDQLVGKAMDSVVSKLNGSAKPENKHPDETTQSAGEERKAEPIASVKPI